jgi:hypothetical protein
MEGENQRAANAGRINLGELFTHPANAGSLYPPPMPPPCPFAFPPRSHVSSQPSMNA